MRRASRRAGTRPLAIRIVVASSWSLSGQLRLFRNLGTGRFEERTAEAGLGGLVGGLNIQQTDYNNDGDQEVYAVMGGAYTGDRYRNALFLNPGHGGRWIKLDLEGTRSNRAAIGARIKVVVETPGGPRTICRTVTSGGSFGSSPLRQEIGLGEASTGQGAVRMIARTAPDLAFLRIELGGLDGFGVLDALSDAVPPAVVLVADHPGHAARAFGRRATDYLLHPIDPDRLRRTLDKVRLRLARVPSAVLSGLLQGQTSEDHLAVRSGPRIRMVSFDDVAWIRASGRYCEIQLRQGDRVSAHVSLASLAQRLPALHFVRVNRSVLVRLDRVIETRPKSHGDHWLVLDSGDRVVLSRNRRRVVLGRLGYRP